MNEKEVKAYIGLGSNIGDREANLSRAVAFLGQVNGVEVIAVSSYYNTAPVGYVQQPDFLNAAAEIITTLSADELLQVCNCIEKELRRERIIRWGPRTIDLDILLYGDRIINEKYLTVPHPRMHERIFVLEPLNEIAPQALHPVYRQTVREMYQVLLNR
ncbi:MAG: 2-amino-4-hydroxy-6-hydroxymethyldihydropteridine diphosphokinase [Clostridia bacterium]